MGLPWNRTQDVWLILLTLFLLAYLSLDIKIQPIISNYKKYARFIIDKIA